MLFRSVMGSEQGESGVYEELEAGKEVEGRAEEVVKGWGELAEPE